MNIVHSGDDELGNWYRQYPHSNPALNIFGCVDLDPLDTWATLRDESDHERFHIRLGSLILANRSTGTLPIPK